MTPILLTDRVGVFVGDCRNLSMLDDASVDAVVTDPPYELGFMGKQWDASGIAYDVSMWREVLRVLKPGGHLLAFGGTRTYHRMTVAIEDAGFEIRDSLHWIYGTGFPKSLDVSKAIDAAAGKRQPVVVDGARGKGVGAGNVFGAGLNVNFAARPKTAPVTAAAAWKGWGTALKPGHEPIVLARKPLDGTVAANVSRYGTGALNIDACRIGDDVVGWGGGGRGAADDSTWDGGTCGLKAGDARPAVGRWPANVLLDEGAANELGDPARFFYVAKPSRAERDAGCDALPLRTRGELTGRTDDRPGTVHSRAGSGSKEGSRNTHPTVKPVALMRYLVRLVTPPGGLVLDPFLGSGTTGIAAALEGFDFVGVEQSAEYAEIAKARITHHMREAA